VAYRIYVVELAPGAGRRRDQRIPWVYVGSSSRDPELRFEQHRRGYKSARIVRRWGLRLRPDLYDDLDPLRTPKAGVAAEKERAIELARSGFVAHCDGTSYGEGEGGWEEWGPARAERVAGHVEAAARELADAAFEPLMATDCARLLHGERGFWVERYLDTEDPPPSYGLFAHVSLGALEPMAARVV
jgi:hypothetical protein